MTLPCAFLVMVIDLQALVSFVMDSSDQCCFLGDGAFSMEVKKKEKKSIGRILLKGDNITLMMNTGSS